MILTKDYLCSLFTEKDGVLYRKETGQKAGYVNSGYYKVKIKGKAYFAHRIIFMMYNDYLPQFIDHVDRNPLNNNINNLRAATRQENNANVSMRKDNTSTVKGVNFHKNKWNVRISVNGKRKHIGSYNDLELAELVSIMAREKYHGNFACHR